MTLKLKELLTKILQLLSYDSGWKAASAGDASGYTKFTPDTLLYRKKLGTCWVMMYSGSSTITSGWKNIGKLPSNACPDHTIYASMSNRQGHSYEIQIQTDGNVFCNPNVNTTWMSGLISFPVSN